MPPLASESPSLLMANFFTEQPLVAAARATSNRNKHGRDLVSIFVIIPPQSLVLISGTLPRAPKACKRQVAKTRLNSAMSRFVASSSSENSILTLRQPQIELRSNFLAFKEQVNAFSAAFWAAARSEVCPWYHGLPLSRDVRPCRLSSPSRSDSYDSTKSLLGCIAFVANRV